MVSLLFYSRESGTIRRTHQKKPVNKKRNVRNIQVYVFGKEGWVCERRVRGLEAGNKVMDTLSSTAWVAIEERAEVGNEDLELVIQVGNDSENKDTAVKDIIKMSQDTGILDVETTWVGETHVTVRLFKK